jgi:uncharacterized protein (DUF58 family)
MAVRANRLTRAREAFTDRTGITATGALLAGLSVLAWVMARLVGGRPLYLFAYGMAAVGVASWLSGRRPLPIEGARSDSRPRLAEGESISMDITLTAKRRLSTFILEEQMPASLGPPARVPIASAQAGETVGHSYKFTASRRGRYQLGPLVAKWGDPLGFTQRQVTLVEPYEVLVHPSVELVQDRPLTRLFEDPPIRPPVSKPWPQGLEFYGMREYAPGDDIRRVVWRAFGRTGKLLVRESEQGITDKITIVLDQNKRSHTKTSGARAGGEVSESFEAAVKAAASRGVRHLREGYAVTLEGNKQRVVPVLRGGNSQMLLLDELAKIELVDAPLTDAIMRLVANPSRDNHVVILTPRLEADATARLKLLLDRGTSVLVAVLVWDDGAEATVAQAASLGCQVVEIRPNTSLNVAFHREVGAGRL